MRLPPERYYASLPRHIAGAGAILHDPDGRILLVKPAYRSDTWEIPGGAMEDGEFPWETAHREVKEELGIELRPAGLLVVDWVPPQSDGRPALANYLFDGGTMTTEQAEQSLHLQPEELTAWRLAGRAEWDELLAEHMTQRVRACATALATGRTTYLQHGWPLTG